MTPLSQNSYSYNSENLNLNLKSISIELFANTVLAGNSTSRKYTEERIAAAAIKIVVKDRRVK